MAEGAFDELGVHEGGQPVVNDPTDTRPLKEKYASELAQIKEMGFTDEDKVLEALKNSNGNVQVAMERLFL